MKTVIYFVVTFTVIVAKDVDVYVFTGDENGYRHAVETKPTSLLTIEYNYSDSFSMEIFLENNELNVSADVYLRYPSGEQKFKEYYYQGKLLFYWLRLHLNYTNISIDLELSTTTGLCATKQIAEGKAVLGSEDKSDYGRICLKKQWCILEVDLSKIVCVGPRFVTTNKSQIFNKSTHKKGKEKKTTVTTVTNVETSIYNTSTLVTDVPTSQQYESIDTTTINIIAINTQPRFVTTNKSQIIKNSTHKKGNDKKTTVTTVANVETSIYNTLVTDVPKSQQYESIDTTTNIIAKDNVKPSNSTLVLVSSLSGIALTLVVGTAIWKHCWIERNPQGTTGLPTSPQSEPFYLNMLFRRECDQEIAEIDQHHYEEIISKGLNTETVPDGT